MNEKHPRIRFRLPPVLLGMAAIFVIGATVLAADTQPTTSPAVKTDSVTDTAMNYWDLYKKGGPFMYPLTLCSVLAIGVIIERFIALRRRVVMPPRFMEGLRSVWRDPRNDREAAIAYCARSDSPIGRMVGAGIKRLPRGLTSAEKAVEDAGANEALKLRRNMRFLYALGSVATLLGLIGTISGMIQAFEANASSGNTPDVAKLSTGIYQAMVNTFAGLAIAIVVTTFYYFFVGRIERLITDMNDALASFSDEYGFNAESDAELRVTLTL